MLTKEVKTFIEIFYLIRYGPLNERVPWQKDEKRLDWTTIQRSCLKSGCPGASHAVAYRGLCEAERATQRRFGLKLTCVLVNGGYFEHRMKC